MPMIPLPFVVGAAAIAAFVAKRLSSPRVSAEGGASQPQTVVSGAGLPQASSSSAPDPTASNIDAFLKDQQHNSDGYAGSFFDPSKYIPSTDQLQQIINSVKPAVDTTSVSQTQTASATPTAPAVVSTTGGVATGNDLTLTKLGALPPGALTPIDTSKIDFVIPGASAAPAPSTPSAPAPSGNMVPMSDPYLSTGSPGGGVFMGNQFPATAASAPAGLKTTAPAPPASNQGSVAAPAPGASQGPVRAGQMPYSYTLSTPASLHPYPL